MIFDCHQFCQISTATAIAVHGYQRILTDDFRLSTVSSIVISIGSAVQRQGTVFLKVVAFANAYDPSVNPLSALVDLLSSLPSSANKDEMAETDLWELTLRPTTTTKRLNESAY